MTYIYLYLTANKTLELVYENALECIILKLKKNKKFSGEGFKEGTPLSMPLPPRRLDSRPLALEPHCVFLTNRTLHISTVYTTELAKYREVGKFEISF